MPALRIPRRMPRYFFHLHNDVDARDEEGVDLPDLRAARTEATRQARDMIGEIVKEEGRLTLHHRIDIEDKAGAVLSTVWFSDAVTVESSG